MNDPLLVRGFERLRDLLGNRQRLIKRDRSSRDPLREILALDELHHEGVGTVGLFQAVNDRDVRMVQRGQEFRFSLESGYAFPVNRECFRQDLDGDLTIEPRVAGLVDLAL